MGMTVSGLECRYQETVTSNEAAKALEAALCHECGVSTRDLMADGQLLEVCGEEFATDIETGERIMVAIPLCPDCHRKNHLDARLKHHPCQVQARNSREGVG